MDSITQGLLGAAIGQAAFRHKLGRRAIAAGAVIGTLPDLDIIANFWGPWTGMFFHRAETHSVFVIPFLAPLIGWLFWRVTHRQNPLKTWMHFAFWALITHPLIDWATSYGTQLAAPFSRHRFALDIIGIIDPFFTTPLLVAVLIGLSCRIANVSARLIGWGALFMSCMWLVTGFNIHHALRNELKRDLQSQGIDPVHLRVTPIPFSLMLWRAAARTADDTVYMAYRSTRRPNDPVVWHSRPRLVHPLAERALATPEGKIFTWFADGFLGIEIEHRPNGHRVFLEDLRYGSVFAPDRGMFRAVAEFDGQGTLLGVFRHHRLRGTLGQELAGTRQMIFQGAPAPAAAAASLPADLR
jgi:inner membrane protein